LYPNPSKDTFFFNIGEDALKSNTDTGVEINIFNSTGNLIHSISNVKSNTNISWDASNVAPGIYYAKISDGGFMKMVKN